jgi:hypothetical protein
MSLLGGGLWWCKIWLPTDHIYGGLLDYRGSWIWAPRTSHLSKIGQILKTWIFWLLHVYGRICSYMSNNTELSWEICEFLVVT